MSVVLVPNRASASLSPLRNFAAGLSTLLQQTSDEERILAEGRVLLARLIADDAWLPQSHATPDPDRYVQYLLHRDPAARFSVVSFVWGPGQSTPIHDHTVWGLVGVLRGVERSERFAVEEGGLVALGVDRLESGAIDAVSPTIGDLHRVSNGLSDRASVSIHVYGADIGTVRRATYDAAGHPKSFVSGYADAPPLI